MERRYGATTAEVELWDRDELLALASELGVHYHEVRYTAECVAFVLTSAGTKKGSMNVGTPSRVNGTTSKRLNVRLRSMTVSLTAKMPELTLKDAIAVVNAEVPLLCFTDDDGVMHAAALRGMGCGDKAGVLQRILCSEGVKQTGKAHHKRIQAENPHLSKGWVEHAAFVEEQRRKGSSDGRKGGKYEGSTRAEINSATAKAKNFNTGAVFTVTVAVNAGGRDRGRSAFVPKGGQGFQMNSFFWQARLRVVPTRLGITETEKETLEKGGSVNKESMKKNSVKSAVKVQISGFQLVAKPSV